MEKSILTRLWQSVTNEVCRCNHQKGWHHPLAKGGRSHEQCGAFVFEGGAFGDGGNLHCCQCLSYNPRPSRIKYLIKELSWGILGLPKVPDTKVTAKSYHCICGHTAFDHDIGNDERIRMDVLYPPCNLCKCKEYDYVNNPKIARNEIPFRHGVEQ